MFPNSLPEPPPTPPSEVRQIVSSRACERREEEHKRHHHFLRSCTTQKENRRRRRRTSEGPIRSAAISLSRFRFLGLRANTPPQHAFTRLHSGSDLVPDGENERGFLFPHFRFDSTELVGEKKTLGLCARLGFSF